MIPKSHYVFYPETALCKIEKQAKELGTSLEHLSRLEALSPLGLSRPSAAYIRGCFVGRFITRAQNLLLTHSVAW